MSNSIPDAVRAKLYVSAVNSQSYSPGNPVFHTAHLNAVYSPDPATENHSFWKATPNAQVKARTLDRDLFTTGEFYYLDFVADENGGAVVAEAVPSDHQSGKSLQVRLSSFNAEGEKGPFAEWTEVGMWIDNDAVFGFFELGKRYNLTFIRVQ